MSKNTGARGASLNSNIKQAIGLSLYGMSMDNRLPSHGYDSETSSMVFFTKPQLNLSSENLSQVREFANLRTKNKASIGNWVRNTLDPRLSSPALRKQLGGIPSPLVNNKYGFIPALTNLCIKTSGWPTRAVSTYVSEPGKYREVYMQVDGRSRMEGPVTITAEFARVPGDPVTSLIETWGVYPEYVFEGLMDPYIDMILAREIDYNVRMFIFNFDWTGTRIVRTGSTLPGIHMVSGDGESLNFDRSSTSFTSNPTVTFPMKFPAVIQNDPAILTDFNGITMTFHSKMKPNGRHAGMRRVGYHYRGYFKGYLYPWINLETTVLETWVEESIFSLVSGLMVQHNIIDNIREIDS